MSEGVKIKKNLKKVTTTVIIIILSLNFTISINQHSSAGIIVNFSSSLLISLNSTNYSEPIVPVSELRNYNIDIEYIVTGSPFGRFLIYPLFYEDKRIDISISVKDKPEWAIVTLPIQTISANIPSIGETIRYSADVQIKLKEDAPALEPGVITLEFFVPTMGHIRGFDQVFSLSFKPAYLPLIDVKTQNTSQRISPKDVAIFPIEITNFGNGRTKCFLEIENNSYPEGWQAEIEESVIIEIGKEKYETVYLTVYPPNNTGFHDDKTSISIDITPTWAEDINIRGEPYRFTVIIESKGNIEDKETNTWLYYVIIALIIIAILIPIFIFYRIKKKGIK